MASHAGLVKLSSAFIYCGHVCLVLERLYGNLLDYVVHSASLPKAQALQNLRKIAVQLLVRSFVQHMQWHESLDAPTTPLLLPTTPSASPFPPFFTAPLLQKLKHTGVAA